mmetsp:Transcript_9067/g.34210  ORF Transcript_9067/g.34210 Transcript_9067/m.34210 type:complete len:244 (+) Transcript_9067:293-1024(+)
MSTAQPLCPGRLPLSKSSASGFPPASFASPSSSAASVKLRGKPMCMCASSPAAPPSMAWPPSTPSSSHSESATRSSSVPACPKNCPVIVISRLMEARCFAVADDSAYDLSASVACGDVCLFADVAIPARSVDSARYSCRTSASPFASSGRSNLASIAYNQTARALDRGFGLGVSAEDGVNGDAVPFARFRFLGQRSSRSSPLSSFPFGSASGPSSPWWTSDRGVGSSPRSQETWCSRSLRIST